MLRRIFTTQTSKLAISATTLLCQGRYLIHFSEQNKVLANNQEHKGYSSNVWISAEDLGKSVKTSAKPSEAPTEVQLTKSMSLWNAAQLLPPVDEPEPQFHTSLTSGKKFAPGNRKVLRERAEKHGFTSKLWLTPTEAKRRGLSPLPGNRYSIICFRVTDQVFNAEQLDDPEELLAKPTKGDTGYFFNLPTEAQALINRQKEMGYSTGLWFPNFCLAEMELSARPDEAPVAIVDGVARLPDSQGQRWYNAEQIVDFEDILKKLNRSPASEHTVLFTGKKIFHAKLLEKMASTNFSAKLWVPSSTLELQEWNLVPDAVPIDLNWTLSYFNAAQLTDPSKGFEKAGLYTR